MMHNKQLINEDELKNILEHIGVPEMFIPVFVKMGTLKLFNRHELAIDLNEECLDVFIVLDGSFASQQLNEKKEFRTVNFFLDVHEPYMTSFHSFFKGGPSRVRLLSLQKSLVLLLKRVEIDQLNENYIEFKNFYIDRLVNALLIENEFKSHLITKSPQEVYKLIIEEHPSLVKRIPNKYIAEFMGLSRVWLSKVKANYLKR